MLNPILGEACNKEAIPGPLEPELSLGDGEVGLLARRFVAGAFRNRISRGLVIRAFFVFVVVIQRSRHELPAALIAFEAFLGEEIEFQAAVRA